MHVGAQPGERKENWKKKHRNEMRDSILPRRHKPRMIVKHHAHDETTEDGEHSQFGGDQPRNEYDHDHDRQQIVGQAFTGSHEPVDQTFQERSKYKMTRDQVGDKQADLRRERLYRKP